MFEIKLTQSLNLDLTLGSGQCFRWNKIGDWWYGVVNGTVWKCKVEPARNVTHSVAGGDGVLLIEAFVGAYCNTPLQDDIIQYFNLDRDYDLILDSICKDSHMQDLIHVFRGMRIVNQDPYETLLSYILSANNNVPAIRKLVTAVSSSYGNKIETDAGDFYTFPTLSELMNVTEEEFRKLKFGFRAKYFKGAIEILKQVQDDNSFWNRSAGDRSLLTNFYGVGDKIADCTRVYSLHRDEVVPVDVWIRRILTNLYNFPEKMKYQDVQDFAIDYFGNYAGWAQLFLFEGGRKKIIGSRG